MSDGYQDRVAHLLERVPEPDGHGITTKDRLALLADQGLWIATATPNEKGDLRSATIERLALRLVPVRASLTETYSHASGTTTSEWLFVVDGSELAFVGKTGDDPALVFGSQLVKALQALGCRKSAG